MNELVLDTNILIYLLQGNMSVRALLENQVWFISFITELELQMGPEASPGEMKAINALLADCRVLEMNDQIKSRAILNAKRHRLKQADSIVLATAQYIGATLVTADLEFKKVNDPDSDVIIIRP